MITDIAYGLFSLVVLAVLAITVAAVVTLGQIGSSHGEDE